MAKRAEQTVGRNGAELGPPIDGVELVRLTSHVDHRGSLTQLIDARLPFWSDPIVYGYEVTIRPGRIKGWGMHEHQDDRYVVTGARMRVGLHDGRPDSPTYGTTAQVYFSEQTPGLLRIPAGVWHADQNWGETDLAFTNFPTRAYDPEQPDKLYMDPHSGEIPFDWSLPDG